MSIELTHLRYFVEVAEELHFGRAAVKLAISQPPLTQQIQRLEQRIGYPLFERSTRRTVLTEAGAALLPLAKATLEAAGRAVEATQRAGRGDAGQLIIGTPPSVMLTALPKVIRKYRRINPGVDVRLREMSTAAIAEALRGETVDIGFLRSPALPEGLTELLRFHEKVVAILPPGHRLGKTAKLRLNQLANDPFVFFPRALGPDFYDELLGELRPTVVQEATQWSSVLALVEAGLGVTIGPASIARLAGRGCTVRVLASARTTALITSGRSKPGAASVRFVSTGKFT